MAADSLLPVKNNLIVPSVSSDWTPEEVFNTGILDTYGDFITALAVEQCVLLWSSV